MGKRSAGVAEGAALLALSGILCKILGVAFKVPLCNLGGGAVMADYSLAMSAFSFAMMAVTAGLPTAVAGEVAASPDGASRRGAVRAALWPAVLFGAAASGVLAVGAGAIAGWCGAPSAANAIRAVAPGVFACCAASVLRGGFQGQSRMLPTATAQLLESVLRLAVGISLARSFLQSDPALASAGALWGVTAGEWAALGLLTGWMLLSRRGEGPTPRVKVPFRRIFSVAAPLTAGALIHSAAGLADSAILLRRLAASGLTAAEAARRYGIFNGYCFTLYSFPPTLMGAVTASLLPAVARRYARFGAESVGELARRGITVCLLIALPCMAGYIAIPGPLLSLFFTRGEEVAMAAPLLAALAPGLVFLAIGGISGAVLTATGGAARTTLATGIGCFARLMTTWLLAGDPSVGIFAAPLASVVCGGVTAMIQLSALQKRGLLPDLHPLRWGVPLLCAGLCGTVALGAWKVLRPSFGKNWAAIAAAACAAIAYTLACLGTKTVKIGRKRLQFPYFKL